MSKSARVIAFLALIGGALVLQFKVLDVTFLTLRLGNVARYPLVGLLIIVLVFAAASVLAYGGQIGKPRNQDVTLVLRPKKRRRR